MVWASTERQMTAALQKIISRIELLSEEEQDYYAEMWMIEMEAEDAFDARIAATADQAGELARRAMNAEPSFHTDYDKELKKL